MTTKKVVIDLTTIKNACDNMVFQDVAIIWSEFYVANGLTKVNKNNSLFGNFVYLLIVPFESAMYYQEHGT